MDIFNCPLAFLHSEICFQTRSTDLIQSHELLFQNGGLVSHKENSLLHIAMEICKNEFWFRQKMDRQRAISMDIAPFYAVAVLHAPPAQHDDASAVSGRLSFRTTKASHSLPSGS